MSVVSTSAGVDELHVDDAHSANPGNIPAYVFFIVPISVEILPCMSLPHEPKDYFKQHSYVCQAPQVLPPEAAAVIF